MAFVESKFDNVKCVAPVSTGRSFCELANCNLARDRPDRVNQAAKVRRVNYALVIAET
jgi:hypothetical protein